MSTQPIDRLLLVEDDNGFARLLRQMFKAYGYPDIAITHVESMAEAEQHLAHTAVDIVLLDPGLPDSQGMDSVRRAIAVVGHTPLVILTGRDDEELALQALQAGAHDYLVKGSIDTRGLLRFLRYAVERSALEAALFVEQDRAEVTLHSIADAVACTDASGRITFLNQVAERLTGWCSADAAGRPATDVIHVLRSGDRRPWGGVPEAANADRTTDEMEADSILVRRDGSETAVDSRVSPIRDRADASAGAVMVFRDVSLDRATARQLRDITEELRRSNRDLQDFAFVASHDLQEPLRKIQAFGDLLMEQSAGALDDECADYLRRMQDAAARMQSLIEHLLDYSQLGVEPETPVAVDLGRVAKEVLDDLEIRLREGGGTVHVGALPTILGSPQQMCQLFQNLISNALKFHPAGVAPVVDVSATGTHETWQIRVSDNGVGFDSQHAETIFAPFQRLHGRQAFAGSGMGLAICRRIVTLHGGTIVATAGRGDGATFLVTLPNSHGLAAAS